MKSGIPKKVPGMRTGKFSFMISPADELTFSAARFAVMMLKLEDQAYNELENIEDLNSIDFFAVHPFIVFQPDSEAYLALESHGLSETLEYTHPEPLFMNQRDEAKAIVAFLLAKRAISEKIDKGITYLLTPLGRNIASKLDEDYYIGYCIAVDEIIKFIPKQQNKWRELRDKWLAIPPKFTNA